MLLIPTPNAAYSEISIPLGGKNYTFTYNFNARDDRWRLSIRLGENKIILGATILESTALLPDQLSSDWVGGNIFCNRFEENDLPCGRSNLGINKAYTLCYYTEEELNVLAQEQEV